MDKRLLFICVLISAILCACSERKINQVQNSSISFSLLPSSHTNVTFNNLITEDDSVNLIYNSYAYMGAGVGVGDFNNDGLQDLFFTASQESSKLYLNKGNFVFEDITVSAGLETTTWITGVSVVDINADGYDDIYICAAYHGDPQKRLNKLFINNGNLHFTEMASAYGLDDNSFSTQAVFFDYDKDGDLDMFLLNHFNDHKNSNVIVDRKVSVNSPGCDRLYRNNGVDKKKGHPVFEDVTLSAGIADKAYGLGVVVSDVNNDGWPDLYVANDYLQNDQLWINEKNGTFSNSIKNSMKHQSYSSMGVDAADLNNDGLMDIISLDMMPQDNYRNKMMYSFLNYDRFSMEKRAGYEPQFIRNMLQLNNGIRYINDTPVVFFSEIGQLAGMAETDWSWSVLMADLNNDGWKDIHITNGMGKDMINSDFILYYASSVRKATADFKSYYKHIRETLNSYGSPALYNYCYQNNGGLNFADVSSVAGIGDSAVSNGCVYVDLDNDGDLDLVVNNINKEAFVLKNNARNSPGDTTNNFIMAVLNGNSLNKKGIGAKLIVYNNDEIQVVEHFPVKGYLSSVDTRLHFGLSNFMLIDSIRVVWPDGKQEVLKNISANSVLKLDYQNAYDDFYQESVPTYKHIVQNISGKKGLDFLHKETPFYDYGYQQLLPQKYSQLGPFITEGDINGDGLTDFFIGGGRNQWGKFYIQQNDGSFISRDLSTGTKLQEDLGCLLFDVDGDKDLDLFINSGGVESDLGSVDYLPRLYINDGKGNFSISADAIPQTIFTSAQAVAAADYDGDGDLDLFIGGRITPRQYPVIPNSYILRNDNGKFSIVTSEVCPELENIGMITSAIWQDIDGDGKPDLLIAGELMSVKIFKNSGNRLKEITGSAGLAEYTGQWRSLHLADIDGDGDKDIVAGNLGLNNHYYKSAKYPLKLFAKDIDGNGSIDPIVAYYRKDTNGEKKLFPAISREQFAAQVPLVKKKFLFNENYAASDIEAVLTGTSREDIIELTCNESKTVWFENTGNTKFVMHSLPVEAQFAPVNAIQSMDINGDGHLDLILAGNEYQAEVMTGQYDASYGLILLGEGSGNFRSMRAVESGLIIDGDVKDLKIFTTNNNEHIILAAVNADQLQSFLLK